MVSQGLQCVKSSVSSTTNLYTQALLAYTFSLAGNMNIRNILLEKLDQQAIVSGMLAMLAFALFFEALGGSVRNPTTLTADLLGGIQFAPRGWLFSH